MGPFGKRWLRGHWAFFTLGSTLWMLDVYVCGSLFFTHLLLLLKLALCSVYVPSWAPALALCTKKDSSRPSPSIKNVYCWI